MWSSTAKTSAANIEFLPCSDAAVGHIRARNVEDVWSKSDWRNGSSRLSDCRLALQCSLKVPKLPNFVVEQCSNPWLMSSGIMGTKCEGFLKWGYPQIIHFNGMFPYKPTIFGYPHLWKPPCTSMGPGNIWGWSDAPSHPVQVAGQWMKGTPSFSVEHYVTAWCYAGWWFGTFFIFPYNNHPDWLIFFRGVETTNQYAISEWYPSTSAISSSTGP